MSEKQNNIQNEGLDDDLLKALEELNFSQEEINDIFKGEEKEKTDQGEEEKEGDEEDYDKMKSDYDKLSKACGMKKAKMEAYEKKMEAAKAEKSEKNDLEKSKVEEESKKPELNQDELVKSITESVANPLMELVKSMKEELSSVNEKNEQLQKSIDEIGKQRPGMKSITTNILEKGGFGEDENGKKMLSTKYHRDEICKELEKAIDEETNESLVKSLSNDLLGYNAGGAKISQDTADYMLRKRNVRLGQ